MSKPSSQSAAECDSHSTASANSEDHGSAGKEGKHPLVHQVLALGLRLVFGFFLHVPAFLAYGIANLLTVPLVAFTLLHERKVKSQGRGMFRNQRIAFRDQWSPEFSRKLLWAWAKYMTHNFVDFCRMPKLAEKSLFEKYVDNSDLEMVRPYYQRGKGLMCVTGHIGLWELGGTCAGHAEMPLIGVARPLSIPLLNQLVNGVRESGGQKILSKWGVVRAIRRLLNEKQAVAVVGDENVKEKPLFVPFLGTLAATGRTTAKLHLLSGAPILVATVMRQKGWRPRFKFHVWKIIEHEKTGDADADLWAITKQINDALSEAIYTYPEQWLWGSRRFMTRPEGEVLGEDGLPPVAEGS